MRSIFLLCHFIFAAFFCIQGMAEEEIDPYQVLHLKPQASRQQTIDQYIQETLSAKSNKDTARLKVLEQAWKLIETEALQNAYNEKHPHQKEAHSISDLLDSIERNRFQNPYDNNDLTKIKITPSDFLATFSALKLKQYWEKVRLAKQPEEIREVEKKWVESLGGPSEVVRLSDPDKEVNLPVAHLNKILELKKKALNWAIKKDHPEEAVDFFGMRKSSFFEDRLNADDLNQPMPWFFERFSKFSKGKEAFKKLDKEWNQLNWEEKHHAYEDMLDEVKKADGGGEEFKAILASLKFPRRPLKSNDPQSLKDNPEIEPWAKKAQIWYQQNKERLKPYRIAELGILLDALAGSSIPPNEIIQDQAKKLYSELPFDKAIDDITHWEKLTSEGREKNFKSADSALDPNNPYHIANQLLAAAEKKVFSLIPTEKWDKYKNRWTAWKKDPATLPLSVDKRTIQNKPRTSIIEIPKNPEQSKKNFLYSEPDQISAETFGEEVASHFNSERENHSKEFNINQWEDLLFTIQTAGTPWRDWAIKSFLRETHSFAKNLNPLERKEILNNLQQENKRLAQEVEKTWTEMSNTKPAGKLAFLGCQILKKLVR